MALPDLPTYVDEDSPRSESSEDEEEEDTVRLPSWTNHIMYFPPFHAGRVRWDVYAHAAVPLELRTAQHRYHACTYR